MEFLGGNLTRSGALAAGCFERARLAGFLKYQVGSKANLALHALAKGDGVRARSHLDFVFANGKELTYIIVAALDNLAQIDLFDGNVEHCGVHLEEAKATAEAERVPARTWNDLANDQTRCAYLECLHDWQGVLEVVDAADPELARRQFRSIRTTLLCAKARALGRLGEHGHAAETLGRAVSTCPRGAVDPQIILEASQGLCAALRADRSAGAGHMQRARAAARAIGHRYHEWWIGNLQDSLDPATWVMPTAPRPTTETALLLSDVSTVLGAGHSVDLLAERAAGIIRSTELADRLRVETEAGLPYQPFPVASSTMSADGTFALTVGASDRRVTLHVTSVRTLEERTLLHSVSEFARAAAHRSTVGDDEGRQTLWPAGDSDAGDDAVFRSPRLIELLRVAARLADTNLPLLVTGETGTGKEILARFIHDQSRVKRGPFVPFNCSAIPRELVESQLFGHRRGAFTGALDAHTGVIRAADNGTLFLDELGDLDPAIQPKLLRFLESGEILPVGESRPLRVHVRVVAATNVDLADRVARGDFRRDLFYRVGGATVELPPLRERKDEIPAFASLFLRRYSRECGRTNLRLSDDFIAALLLSDWPGNIRQLANEVRRVVALADNGQTLTAGALLPELTTRWRDRTATPDTAPPARPTVSVGLDQPLTQAVEELEQRFIEHALDLSGGRVAEAARHLGLSRKGLFLKRRRQGMV